MIIIKKNSITALTDYCGSVGGLDRAILVRVTLVLYWNNQFLYRFAVKNSVTGFAEYCGNIRDLDKAMLVLCGIIMNCIVITSLQYLRSIVK